MRLTPMAVLAAVLLSSTLDADVVFKAIRATGEFYACKGRSASHMGDFLAALVRRDRQAALEAMRETILAGVPTGDCFEIKEGETFEIMTSAKDKHPLSLKERSACNQCAERGWHLRCFALHRRGTLLRDV